MEPDGHVVLLELEQVRELLIRQPLDIPQQEQRGVFSLQGSDRAPQLLFQQQRRLDGRVRRPIVVARFRVHCPPAQLYALGGFLRDCGADTVSVSSLDYVLDRDNPLFARLDAFLR